jgi:hypothetical protein
MAFNYGRVPAYRKPAKSWGVIIIRSKGEYLGLVEVPDRDKAEAVAVKQFALDQEQVSSSESEPNVEPRRRNQLERDLQEAERHIAEGRQRIAKQVAIIAELERDGHNSATAKELLVPFSNRSRCTNATFRADGNCGIA